MTQEELEQNGFNNIPNSNYFLGDRTSNFFSDDVYNELCRVLKPSEHSSSKIFFPEILSKNQQRHAISSRNLKRQLKGPAGSGKTTILAFRAVDAFRKTKNPVLILTFNITLCHYIEDCISQALNSIPNISGRKGYIRKNFFQINNFHEFIKNYRAKTNQSATLELNDQNKYVDNYKLKATPIKFHTIYVDETQDFERGWMETIVSLLKPEGELIFFGDKDQDLYEKDGMDNVPTGKTGIYKLKGTYRLHTKILGLARAFQIKFFSNSEDNKIEPPAVIGTLFSEYEDDATTLQYKFFDSLNVDAIVEIFESVIRKYQIPNDDVCILSQILENVRPVDKALRDKKYVTTTTFEKEEDWQEFLARNRALYESDRNVFYDLGDKEFHSIRRSAKKFGFWMESGKIKLTTIQSYKGWGIHTAILIIGNNENSDSNFLNPEMVYTGITRAKKNLVIINIGNKKYDEFFRPEIERLSAKPTPSDTEKISLATQKFNEAYNLYNRGDYKGAISFIPRQSHSIRSTPTLTTIAVTLIKNLAKRWYQSRGQI